MMEATKIESWSIDQAHTMVEFSVRHMMLAKVRGKFTSFTGTMAIEAGGYIPESISVDIDANSISTGEPDRDNHLRSADFLDVEKFPKLTFKSYEIRSTGEGAFDAEADLTIHGVTNQVTLEVTFEGRAKDPQGNERIAYTSEFTINRSDFGLRWNQLLEGGGVLVGEHVLIELTVQAIKQA